LFGIFCVVLTFCGESPNRFPGPLRRSTERDGVRDLPPNTSLQRTRPTSSTRFFRKRSRRAA